MFGIAIEFKGQNWATCVRSNFSPVTIIGNKPTASQNLTIDENQAASHSSCITFAEEQVGDPTGRV